MYNYLKITVNPLYRFSGSRIHAVAVTKIKTQRVYNSLLITLLGYPTTGMCLLAGSVGLEYLYTGDITLFEFAFQV